MSDHSPAPVRVLVVDDQRVVREGLSTLLGLVDGIEVVGTATDGDEAVERVRDLVPDVVLMDLDMPRRDGVDATAMLAGTHPHLPVVVLTTYTDDTRLLAALRAGARGFLTKDAGVTEIESAILAAAQGRAALAPDVQLRLLDALRSGAAAAVPPAGTPASGSADPPSAWLDGLTVREREIVDLVAEGLSNDAIAARLYVSTATVKTHINHIFAKTGVRDRAQLVARVLRRDG